MVRLTCNEGSSRNLDDRPEAMWVESLPLAHLAAVFRVPIDVRCSDHETPADIRTPGHLNQLPSSLTSQSFCAGVKFLSLSRNSRTTDTASATMTIAIATTTAGVCG